MGRVAPILLNSGGRGERYLVTEPCTEPKPISGAPWRHSGAHHNRDFVGLLLLFNAPVQIPLTWVPWALWLYVEVLRYRRYTSQTGQD